MALACKCDRCGKFFNVGTDYRVDRIRIASCFIDADVSNPKNIKEYDVCETCSEQFMSWINKK